MLFHLVLITLAFITTQSNAADVFLGGSCNPTTWRTDIVIPAFTKLDITYYNPQVAEWSEELMEAENKAKAEATILFFVLDKQTRALASIVEVAYLAAAQRKIVLVLDQFSKTDCKIGINAGECESLANGRLFLRGIVESIQNLPATNDINVGIEKTAIALDKKKGPKVVFGGSKPKPGEDDQIFVVGITSKPASKELPSDVKIEWSDGNLITMDNKNFQKSKVLLFVIDKNSVNIRVMATAAYYMGLGFRVVLFVQDFVGGKSDYMKDYNRPRSYLKDAAKLLGVPVHTDGLEKAYKCAVAKLKGICTVDEVKNCCKETRDSSYVVPSIGDPDENVMVIWAKRLTVIIASIGGVLLILAVVGVIGYMCLGRGGDESSRSRSRSRASSRASSRYSSRASSRSGSRSSRSSSRRKSSQT